ncbi:MAG TPA: non-homologous end-joining DNA ligase [Terriglobales bacterium]|nr:non-homologous end-joining DNA ligase [Terriglobales bacterium]
MPLEEYKRKRRFEDTPEPPPKLEPSDQHRFVVQKHRATRLHYDFRLEMDGVLKSWAVPKGPSLDPADKRLATQVEDHPVSYFDFEGIIPPGNYGAGTVMVWDVGTFEPLGDADAMMKKGDFKFRLHGQKLNGDFVLVHIKSRRPGSKGTEWLLIKHRDQYVQSPYDANDYDYSALTKRSLAEIAGDEGAREWQSSRPAASRGKPKAPWLAEALAKRRQQAAEESATKNVAPPKKAPSKAASATTTRTSASRQTRSKKSSAKSNTRSSDSNSEGHTERAETPEAAPNPAPAPVESRSRAVDPRGAGLGGVVTASEPSSPLAYIKGVQPGPMPKAITPMLATLTDRPFDDENWLFEVKWDGYRALAYVDGGKLRLVSRNQNDLTAGYPELRDLPAHVKARTAIIDGEIVALDEQGRSSFSLMQQRTGLRHGGHRTAPDSRIPVLYYAFDLLYLDGYNLMRVDLDQRKQLLKEFVTPGASIRISEYFVGAGTTLYEACKEHGLEGIIAKRRQSCYLEKRTREWLKLKITQRQECVVGGYTDPAGGREYFGSVILGLYDDQGRLIHVGHAGSGFNSATLADTWQRLKPLATTTNPFHGKVENLGRKPHWVRPELVAEIKFTEWTHEGQSGSVKMRAPVFEGLRLDKNPRECVLESAVPAPQV